MNSDPSGYFTITEEMCVLGMQGVAGAYINVTITMLGIFFQGDNYKGDIGTDFAKSIFSGLISGIIVGALIPFFAGAGLTAGVLGVALFIIAVLVCVVGFMFKVAAEVWTPEGSYTNMNDADKLLFLVGAACDTIGDSFTAPIRAVLKIPEAIGFVFDLLVAIFQR